MSHNLIKFDVIHNKEDGTFYKKYEYGEEADPISEADAKAWHLTTSFGDGESLACGQIYSDYAYYSKKVDRGGITCKDCLNAVKEFKAIKL